VADDKKEDLYGVLGVARDASDEAIRKAYRKLARRYHPDVNPGDASAEERFKKVSEAYAVLSDTERRRNYDEFGEISLEVGFDAARAREMREAFGRRFGADRGPRGPGDAGEAFRFGGLDDLFSDLFAQRGWEEMRHARGADLEAELELDFLDAVRGGEHRITIARPAADGSVRRESITVRIPAGVSDGGRIRLRGKGGEGAGEGGPGDLYARIRVRPHPLFRREGRDVYFDLPVTVREATLGARISVPTLDGRATLVVPAGTDSGAKLRLRGKGVPDPSGAAPGDLYAVVQIRVPRDLGPEARARLEAALDGLDPADVRRGLFEW
jgi:DnaJ-class molecular chaperone